MDETPERNGYVTSDEAAALLGVKSQTLFAYVSRGLLRSVRIGRRKERLYARADVQRLRMRTAARGGLAPAAASAMQYGEPIISSAITDVGEGDDPHYRGISAIELVRQGYTFEDVAELLWSGTLQRALPENWRAAPTPEYVHAFARGILEQTRGRTILSVLAVYAFATGLQLGETEPAAVARRILRTLPGCFGYLHGDRAYRGLPGGSVAEGLLYAAGASATPENVACTQAMLVMLADYELASTTLVARVAASVGSPVSACLVAAIESSTGRIAEYQRVSRLFTGITSRDALKARIERMLRSGRVPPGFNSGIHRHGDPRAFFLVELAERTGSVPPAARALIDVLNNDADALGLYPRAVLGLEILAQSLQLPRGAAPGVLVLARVAGWTAHVMEQVASEQLLRPRARFTPPVE